MDDGSSISFIHQMLAAAPRQVLPVWGVAGAAVGVVEGMNFLGGEGASGAGGGDSISKRKRGRPKKQMEGEAQRQSVVAVVEPSALGQKRGRGRPRGSGKWQTLGDSFSGTALETAGSNFTPYTVTVHAGENIVQRICSFAESASDLICILSASGPVSSVELLGSFHGALIYKGQFQVITLSASYARTGKGQANKKNFALTVQLANSDGVIFGGAVGSLLIAGAPLQLIIATFKQKPKGKAKTPRPNNAAISVPPSANSQLHAAGEANGLMAVSPTPAPQVEAFEKFMNAPDLSHVSLQPFDWSALLPSSSLSQHVTAEFNPGIN